MLDSGPDLVGAAMLPGVEHGIEQFLTPGELAIEPAARDTQCGGEGFDPDGVGAGLGEHRQGGVDPGLTRGSHWWRHLWSTNQSEALDYIIPR